MDIVEQLKSIAVDITPFSRRHFIKKGAEKIEELRKQVALRELEIVKLREVLEAIDESGLLRGSYGIHDKCNDLLKEALSTPLYAVKEIV
jgi:hypothetical protein